MNSDQIEVPTLSTILPSTRFINVRLTATNFKEGVHLDSRKGLGIYHRIHRIGKTHLPDYL